MATETTKTYVLYKAKDQPFVMDCEMHTDKVRGFAFYSYEKCSMSSWNPITSDWGPITSAKEAIAYVKQNESVKGESLSSSGSLLLVEVTTTTTEDKEESIQRLGLDNTSKTETVTQRIIYREDRTPLEYERYAVLLAEHEERMRLSNEKWEREAPERAAHWAAVAAEEAAAAKVAAREDKMTAREAARVAKKAEEETLDALERIMRKPATLSNKLKNFFFN